MKRLTILLLVLGVIAFAASLLAGRVWLPPSSLLDIFNNRDSMAALIVTEIRLPRSVLALVTGAVLGLSGAVLQGFTRNPLAEPALLGVSSGAALGAVIAIYFGLAAMSAVAGPLMGMVAGHYGYPSIFLVSAALSGVGMLLAVFLAMNQRQDAR